MLTMCISFQSGCRIHALNHTILPYRRNKAVPEKKLPLVDTYGPPTKRPGPAGPPKGTPNASQLLGAFSLTRGKSLEPQSISEISNMRSDKEPERDHNKPNKQNGEMGGDRQVREQEGKITK